MAERHSIPKPFTSGDAREWFQRYEICYTANRWENATNLRHANFRCSWKEALAVWLELSEEQQGDYSIAKGEILAAISPMEFVSLELLHKINVNCILERHWLYLFMK